MASQTVGASKPRKGSPNIHGREGGSDVNVGGALGERSTADGALESHIYEGEPLFREEVYVHTPYTVAGADSRSWVPQISSWARHRIPEKTAEFIFFPSREVPPPFLTSWGMMKSRDLIYRWKLNPSFTAVVGAHPRL